LQLYCGWIERHGSVSDAVRLRAFADSARKNFNRRVWSDEIGYLFDVVDGEQGDDASLRPNQLFAISLKHAVLDPIHWPAVVDQVKSHLLTPVGLRSLSASDPEYHGVYHGDVWKRDAAYHQGTVWSWLIGPMVIAWCLTYPDRKQDAAAWLDGLEFHLGEACIGQISEVFSGDAPHRPKGCFAQAWGVAELLRARNITTDC
ncbi:amylo-alpha-1,6-glucosidase, partial [Stieleria sp.]|uniref:amylo-alpha-1,6-glucosidase n=1 Tax=Stieleria sp. TaxID=2795976 RepID=UPI0035660A86